MPYSSEKSDSSKIPDMLLTAKEVADYLSISPDALAQDRFRGDGIPFVKIGSRVRYRLSSLLAYLEEKEQRQSQVPTPPANRPARTHKLTRR
ncbi:helix-turn-helix domain-containing protein [Mycobacterium sp. 4D054]|uniref:helix-turn-helix domain-containing protein n=1 Tax=Mycobacterium sp. 4D054 TaxID=3457440 RepID=UPI003FD56E1B